MFPDTPSRRVAAVTSLVAAPLLSGLYVALVTAPGTGGAERLAALADGGTATLGTVAFVISQLPLLIAILAIGRLLIDRAPRLSAWGTALGVLGCFGHAVYCGYLLVELELAQDEPHRAVHAALVDSISSSPLMQFALAGVGGTVLGILILSIGLFRTRTGPIWVAPALWAWLLLEFVGSSFSDYASYIGGLGFFVAFFALAAHIARADHPDPAHGGAAERAAVRA
jgi:hypothetical protein